MSKYAPTTTLPSGDGSMCVFCRYLPCLTQAHVHKTLGLLGGNVPLRKEKSHIFFMLSGFKRVRNLQWDGQHGV